jgi:cation:H+ antiporter
MVMPVLAMIGGLLLLIWGADRFVDSAVSVASHFSVPPLLVGMLIIGFGTSAPEMMVSAFAAAEGKPGLALGNAYGSNIANIAFILGATAVISPIAVQSGVVRKEIPLLLAVTALSAALIADGGLSRLDALILLASFAALIAWSLVEGLTNRDDPLGDEAQEQLDRANTSPRKAFLWLLVGLLLLIGSSRLLVWGAVEIASGLGVSNLIIGLTIVAIGTSLPELAASLSAALKGQPDLALGNVIGSNLFNTLAVVGIAGTVSPMAVPVDIVNRDLLVVGLLTGVLLVFCLGQGKQGRINRLEGALLLASYAAYLSWLIYNAA